jgi:hypothetical protein
MSAIVSPHDLSDVTLWGQQICYLWVPYCVPEVAGCWGSGSTHKAMHGFVVPVCPMCSACHASTHIKETGVQVNGRIAYNGETFDSFYAQRTAAYVDQVTPCPTGTLLPADSHKHAMQNTVLLASFSAKDTGQKSSLVYHPQKNRGNKHSSFLGLGTF